MFKPAIELHGASIGPITVLPGCWRRATYTAFPRSRRPSATADCAATSNTVQRTPLSKQRNKHLQYTLIEAAKMAPRYSSTLALVYDREKQKGNANRATLAVSRKLVAYLLAVDRGQPDFLLIASSLLCGTGPAPRRSFAIRADSGAEVEIGTSGAIIRTHHLDSATEKQQKFAAFAPPGFLQVLVLHVRSTPECN
jgi:hypothetical protein